MAFWYANQGQHSDRPQNTKTVNRGTHQVRQGCRPKNAKQDPRDIPRMKHFDNLSILLKIEQLLFQTGSLTSLDYLPRRRESLTIDMSGKNNIKLVLG